MSALLCPVAAFYSCQGEIEISHMARPVTLKMRRIHFEKWRAVELRENEQGNLQWDMSWRIGLLLERQW
jgi:hypothetical protein